MFSEVGICRSFSSDRTLPARCPFCGAEILRPVEVEGGQWYDFAGGSCACGAVFAHDPTARNGGAVFLQALLMATDGDMDRAMGLAEGVDYDVGYVQKYNGELHRLEPNAFGTLYFVRLRAGRTRLHGFRSLRLNCSRSLRDGLMPAALGGRWTAAG